MLQVYRLLGAAALSPIVLSAPASASSAIGTARDAEALDEADAQKHAPADDVLVTGTRAGYASDESTTGTRTPTPIRDVPQSIQVIPRSVIEDQNSLRLTDVLQNVSGVQPSSTSGNRGEAYLIRGFASPRYAIDGVLLNRIADRAETFLDLANVESVGVLKGPASALYGQGDPGGLINITTRRPTDHLTAEINPQVGSFRFARIQATVSGPIDAAGKLALRVTGAAQTSEGFRGADAADSTRQFVSLAARWQPRSGTTINLDVDHTEQAQPFDRGLVVGADNRVTLPARRFLSEPWSTTSGRKTRVALDIAQQASHWLTLHLNGRYTDSSVGSDYAIDYRALGSDGRTLSRRATTRTESLESVDLRGEAVATFATGGIEHVVLAGVGYSRATYDTIAYRANIGSIDIYAPVYDAVAKPVLPLNADTWRGSDLYSAYLQDQVALTHQLKLLGSVRYDEVRDDLVNRVASTENRRSNGAFTWRGGIVYQPVTALSFYGSYAESFQPQTTQRSDLSYLDPERGKQFEVGAKLDPLGGRLTATAAAFRITKRNVATTDPLDSNYSIQTGEQRVQGLELDIAGAIAKRWQVIASGSYLEAEVTRDQTYAVGNRLTNVPRWSGRLWTTYSPGGALTGVLVGGGVTRVGRRTGDLANSFSVAGYTTFDATLRYAVQGGKLEFSLTGRNLSNVYYIESAVARLENYPGAPRSLLASMRARF